MITVARYKETVFVVGGGVDLSEISSSSAVMIQLQDWDLGEKYL